ncbi:ATP-binding protein [Bacillus coreaensis]
MLFVISNYEFLERSEYENILCVIEKEVDNHTELKSSYLIKYAMIEAVNNAVEHGGFPVNIQFLTSKKEFGFKVSDNGRGFLIEEKIKLINDKGLDILLTDCLYEERGRGIYMIYKIANRVIYNKKGNSITVLFQKIEPLN